MADRMHWLDLCDEIDDGELDEGLRDIGKAVASRMEIVSRRNARRLQRELKIGDAVMLTNRITPRYLEGCKGVILKMEDQSAIVKLDSLPVHRGRPSAEPMKDKLRVPFDNLIKLDPDVLTLKSVNLSADIGDDEEYEDEDDD